MKGMKKLGQKSSQEKFFFVLIVIVLLLGSMNVAKAKGWLIPEKDVLDIQDGVVRLDSLSLEQKIAQMVVVHGGTWNLEPWQRMQLGGIHIFAKEKPELFEETIKTFQDGMQIPFFVTADLEGCLNPFAEFRASKPVNEISSTGEAFEKGKSDGAFLSSLGFNLNFAPVVDLDDQIWKCRSFVGDEVEVSELAEAYILGLQSEDIIATAKHFPGKTLAVRDPHKQLVYTEISSEDIYPYQYLGGKQDVGAVMVSHQIASGLIDSSGVPSVVSENAVSELKKKFSGLVITDDTMMLGLRNFYSSVDKMYIAVWKAGNDLILNFDEDPNEIYRMIIVVKEAVESGEISESRIDDSVVKILEAKGFVVER